MGTTSVCYPHKWHTISPTRIQQYSCRAAGGDTRSTNAATRDKRKRIRRHDVSGDRLDDEKKKEKKKIRSTRVSPHMAQRSFSLVYRVRPTHTHVRRVSRERNERNKSNNNSERAEGHRRDRSGVRRARVTLALRRFFPRFRAHVPQSPFAPSPGRGDVGFYLRRRHTRFLRHVLYSCTGDTYL